MAYKTGEVAETIRHILIDFFIDNFDLEMWKDRILHTINNPRIGVPCDYYFPAEF
ncbi:MAG: hypothetical protein U5K54_17655 [Cytophagales bacterium]|nr:hypothetical protein [Cytophagales bacterium]